MTKEKTYNITLVVGDWSHDGHNVTDNVYIEANQSAAALQAAYKRGKKRVGVDLTEDVCRDYEDRSITRKDLDKFIKSGFDPKQLNNTESDDPSGDAESLGLEPEDFALLWMHTASLGALSPLVWVFTKRGEYLNIGGYGLFQ